MVAGITGMAGITTIIVIGIDVGEGSGAAIRTFARSSRRNRLGMHQKYLQRGALLVVETLEMRILVRVFD
ncbi:hypothetical protein WS89_01250 [Burkholderia sp. MSMB1072]|nr:hypothetical protein WS89_01250 [Burkholderia sp. MSMB1072]